MAFPIFVAGQLSVVPIGGLRNKNKIHLSYFKPNVSNKYYLCFNRLHINAEIYFSNDSLKRLLGQVGNLCPRFLSNSR